MGAVPVVEIGGTHVTAALVDTAVWAVIHESMVRRDLDGGGSAEQIIATVITAAADLRPASGKPWGVAIPGPFDYARGVADFHGVGKLDALRGVDLGRALRGALPGAPGRISFVNDAEAFTVGEWIGGAARGHARVLGVTLGTGVGSAFVVDGVSQRRGRGVPPQGRLDLLQIDGRSLEDAISRRAIRHQYASLTEDHSSASPDVREIALRATNGQRAAIMALSEPIKGLGRVLAPRAMEFEASVVVIGGSIARAWKLLKPALSEGMSDTSPGWSDQLLLEPAERLDDAALLGAARHALAQDM